MEKIHDAIKARMLASARIKLERARMDDAGVDPVSGCSVEEIEQWIAEVNDGIGQGADEVEAAASRYSLGLK